MKHTDEESDIITSRYSKTLQKTTNIANSKKGSADEACERTPATPVLDIQNKETTNSESNDQKYESQTGRETATVGNCFYLTMMVHQRWLAGYANPYLHKLVSATFLYLLFYVTFRLF